ncbi:hypothetical protein F946_01044 [Acinetobacter johnsonii ANC 3681]|uniref:Uncharacterized protein n=1 Tax=Acinetobacter johnsonii ANC 3681 TaxID=1217662 RepID=N9BIQ1_ACIJO|nr:hypothetical protein [Acinetobacter johnsonii]ENV73532.1 hypothetical protein F946_01044 [Acinetobacter johnsonii ANC 3681]
MAVQEQTPYIEHVANGVTTSFALGFVCDSADNLVVTINDLPTNVGDWSFSDGNVVFQYPPLLDSLIKIWRNSPLARSTTFKTYDNSLNPNSLNFDLDKIWLVMQELNSNRELLKKIILEQIELQGLTLDQLLELNEDFFQRLSNLNSDKNWDAAFIAYDGGNQEQFNDTQKSKNETFENSIESMATLEITKDIAQKKLIPDLFLPNFGNSKKAMVRRAQYTITDGSTVGSRYWIVVSKAGSPNNHLLFELRRGVLTSTGSLGGAAEFLRVTSIYDGGPAWVGKHANSAVSDPTHWAEVEYTPSGYTERLSHSVTPNVDLHKYYAVQGVALNEFISFNAQFDSAGKANLQFLCTAGSSGQVELYIDDVLKETISLTAATAAIYRHALKAAPGFHTIKVVRKALGSVSVFGCNYSSITDGEFTSAADGLVFWHNNQLYTSSEGASDYAIVEETTGLLGGSLHGGETLQKQIFNIDGVYGDPLAAIRVFSNLEIRQETTIDWGSGKILKNVNSHIFNQNGGYQFDNTFINKVSSKTFYTAMHTTPESFTKVISPNFVNLSLEADGFKYLNRSNTVVQEDSTTSKRIYTQTTIFNEENNVYGAPTVRKVTGSYNKLYYGAAISNPVALELGDFSVSTRKIFT